MSLIFYSSQKVNYKFYICFKNESSPYQKTNFRKLFSIIPEKQSVFGRLGRKAKTGKLGTAR